MQIDLNYQLIKVCIGNDQLKGGAGADVYKLSGAYGTDIITDSDGVGIITVDNVALTGGAGRDIIVGGVLANGLSLHEENDDGE